MEQEPLLKVRDLHTSFFTPAGEVKAVNGVSFNLDRGKVLGIVGESGSGKSVTAYSIMQILASTGKIVSGSQVVHLCGNGRIDNLLLTTEGYKQYEYLKSELKDVMAMSDLVISRAGANAICELLSLRKPNLLIPLSKAASRGDQILNANSFESQGFSLVLQEEDLDEITLVQKVKELDENKEKYIAAMNESNQINAIDKIIALIEDAVINRP